MTFMMALIYLLIDTIMHRKVTVAIASRYDATGENMLENSNTEEVNVANNPASPLGVTLSRSFISLCTFFNLETPLR